MMPTGPATDNKVVNGILTAAILGLISWNLLTTHELSLHVARIEAQMDLFHTGNIR